MLQKSKRKAQFIILATFLMGAFAGGLATYFVQQQQASKATTVTTIVDNFDQRLSLQPEQRKQFEIIVGDMLNDYQKVKESTRPLYDGVRQQAREKIRALLNESQRQPFEQYLQELDAKREQKRLAESNAK
jgi:uncharacterized membrane protein